MRPPATTRPQQNLPYRQQPRETRTAEILQQGPQRTCVGCRRTRSVGELVRCTLGPEGVRAGAASRGRGAWLCLDNPTCFHQAVRRRAFERAWRLPVSAEQLDQVLTALEAVRGLQDQRDRLADGHHARTRSTSPRPSPEPMKG